MPERTRERPEPAATPDARLAEALRPAVEAALKRSVRDEPHTWTEAIFPILLPAIRMAVASALREMVQTLNRVLEESLSLRSLRWRVEAWRSGRPFAEVALLRTLVYRVEQVLLLHRHTGLLLGSAVAPAITPRDPHLVSGMLAALQAFVHDSFEVEKGVGIRELHVGAFSIWVEEGTRAALAVAVRGNAPVELRETLRAAVDLVHQEFGAQLDDFRGDAKPFEQGCSAILEGCLQSQYDRAEKTSYWRVWLSLAGVAAVLVFWAGLRLQQVRRWERGLAALGKAPGILITQARCRGGDCAVEGLRDPLADSPADLLARNGIDPRKISLRFRPFLSLDPELVVKRARAAIQAPGSVSVSLEKDVLKLEGTAPHAWLLQVRNAAGQLGLAGIRAVRTDGLEDSDLASLRADIEAGSILFPVASSTVAPEQARLCQALAAKSQQWVGGVLAIGRVPRLEVIGYTDVSGTVETNRSLSQNRAEHVAAFLLAAGVSPEMLVILGKGAASGLLENSADEALRRKVVLRLSLLDPGSAVRHEVH
jgi:OOP family OmpA-OmpF porin